MFSPLLLYSQNSDEEINNLHHAFKKTIYNDLDKAFNYASESIKKSELTKNKKLMLISYTNLSEIYFLKRKFQTSKKFIHKALSLAKKIKNKDKQVELKIRLGSILSHEDDFTETLNLFQEALQIANLNNLKQRECEIYNNLAKLYRVEGNYKEAMLTFKKSVFLSKKINYQKEIVKAYNGLGNLFLTKNKDSSFVYYYKALKIVNNINNNYLKGIILFR